MSNATALPHVLSGRSNAGAVHLASTLADGRMIGTLCATDVHIGNVRSLRKTAGAVTCKRCLKVAAARGVQA